MPKSEQKNSH